MNELRKSQTFARPGEIPSKARFAKSLALFAHWRQLREAAGRAAAALIPWR